MKPSSVVHKLPKYIRKYPQRFIRCSNGLSVLVLQGLFEYTVQLKWFFYVGSVQDPPQHTGMAHFIEHMFFKGTRHHHSANNLADELDQFGAYVNAFTDKEYTGYEVHIPSIHWKKGLRTLTEMLYDSRFPEDEMKKEKNVVIHELRRNQSTPKTLLEDKADEWAWAGTPYAKMTGGVEDELANITREDIIAHLQKFYTPERSLLVIIGKLPSFQETIPYIIRTVNRPWDETILGKKQVDTFELKPQEPFIGAFIPEWWPIRWTIKHHVQEEYLDKRISKIKHPQFPGPNLNWVPFGSSSQVFLRIDFPAVSVYDRLAKECFYWISSYLTDGMGSKLFIRLREEFGYVYSISSSITTYYPGGIFSIYTATNDQKECIQGVIRVIFEEIYKLAKKNIDKNTFHFYQKMSDGSDLIFMENPSNTATIFSKAYFYRGELPGIHKKETIKYPEITPQHIKNTVRTFMRPEYTWITCVGKPRLEQYLPNNWLSKISKRNTFPHITQ